MQWAQQSASGLIFCFAIAAIRASNNQRWPATIQMAERKRQMRSKQPNASPTFAFNGGLALCTGTAEYKDDHYAETRSRPRRRSPSIWPDRSESHSQCTPLKGSILCWPKPFLWPLGMPRAVRHPKERTSVMVDHPRCVLSTRLAMCIYT